LRVGITVDAAGTPVDFATILGIFEEHAAKATFFIGVKIEPELVKAIHEAGHEIGSHTYSHTPSLPGLPYNEKALEIRSGHLWLTDILGDDSNIRGFRAPFYNFHPDIPKILERLGYTWDSSKAYFPILGSPFTPERHGNIVELPTLHPDDHTMIRRLGLTEEKVLETWKRSYEMSEKAFVLGVHPYICAENEKRVRMLRGFLEHVEEQGGQFCTLSEMAHGLGV